MTETLSTQWAALTNAVGRAADSAHFTPLARVAIDAMLDVLESHYEAGAVTAAEIDDASAWCDRIATVGLVHAGPWAGHHGVWNGRSYEVRS